METVTDPFPPPRRWPRRRVLALATFGALVLVLSAVYIAWRPAYRPLLHGTAPRDAALIAAELKREQLPFRIEPGSGAVLVPERDERSARLQLIGASMHLNEAVGLELFNNSDLGLTDFAQKVNYQRALQGELARTIMSLDEVVLARVHVALPESALFRGHQAPPKASVAVFARDGARLPSHAVDGIQRLVAAAIPGMEPAAVTVLDQRGGALSGRDDAIASVRQFQTATENEVRRKVEPPLRRMLGEGLADLTVHVELAAQLPVLGPWLDLQERELPQMDVEADELAATPASPRTGLRPSVARIAVTVVLERELPADRITQVHDVVSAGAALDFARGDRIHINVRAAPQPAAHAASAALPVSWYRGALIAAVAGCGLAIAFAAWHARRRPRTPLHAREQILRDLRLQLADEGAA